MPTRPSAGAHILAQYELKPHSTTPSPQIPTSQIPTPISQPPIPQSPPPNPNPQGIRPRPDNVRRSGRLTGEKPEFAEIRGDLDEEGVTYR